MTSSNEVSNKAHSYAKSQLTQQRLFELALELVEEQGYAAVTVRKICARAGVSTGAFYHHFKSKEEMLERGFLSFDLCMSEERQASYEALPPAEAIKRILLEQTAFTAGKGYALITEYYRAILQNSSRAAVQPERAYYRLVKKILQKAAEAGAELRYGSVEDTANLLIKYVRGSLIDWCLHNAAYDVTERLRGELAFILPLLGLQEEGGLPSHRSQPCTPKQRKA